jgi:methionyl-tRNA synthetase
MMNYFYANQGVGVPGFMYALLPFMLVVGLWTVFWKGLALWHAGRRGDVAWFLAILVINLLGILEIVYLFGIAKLKFSELFSRKVHHNA